MGGEAENEPEEDGVVAEDEPENEPEEDGVPGKLLAPLTLTLLLDSAALIGGGGGGIDVGSDTRG